MKESRKSTVKANVMRMRMPIDDNGILTKEFTIDSLKVSAVQNIIGDNRNKFVTFSTETDEDIPYENIYSAASDQIEDEYCLDLRHLLEKEWNKYRKDIN